MRKSVILAIILVLQLPLLGVSQSFYSVRRERNLIVNAGVGVSRFYGELVNPGDVGKVKLNINAGAEYFLHPRISARVDASWFQLSGTDAIANSDRRERNLSFFSNNFELDATGSIQLFPNGAKFHQRKSFNLYGVAGVGLLYFNPKAIYQGEKVALQPLQTEGVKYSRFQFVIPMGFGARIKIHPWINVAVEGIYRETFTDYLDDISSREYPDPATLSSPLAVALSDRRRELDPDYPIEDIRRVRGNPDGEDSYFILTAKLQFFIPTSFGSNRKLYSTKRKSTKNRGGMYKVRKGSLKRR